MNYNIDIFIKSFRNDFKLLKYALKSIEMNVTGYNSVIILIPEEDRKIFDFEFINLPERTFVHTINEEGQVGYLFQQVCKMNAYKYCSSEYILFSDSDCIFNKVDLQEFVKEDKPEILYNDWKNVEGAITWKECTENFMGEPVMAEFMRRNFLCYHRSTLVKIAEQRPDLGQQIMESGKFSEFNFIGAWAYKNEREKYSFVNCAGWEKIPVMGVQLWSWANKVDGEFHRIEYARSLKVINETFGLNLTEI